MKWMLSTGALIFGIALYTPSFAQGSMETNKERIERSRATLNLEKKQVVAKNINLTSVEKDKFWALYREYQDKMDSVTDRRIKLLTDYDDTLENGNLTDEKASEMLDEYLSYETERLTTRKSFVEKFRQVLSPRKVTRFFQLENKWEAVLNYELTRLIPLVQ